MFSQGYDSHGCLPVGGQPTSSDRRTRGNYSFRNKVRRVLETATPSSVQWYLQEHGGPGPQQLPVLWLREGPASERDHGVALERFRQIAKCAGFGEPKSELPSIPKNLGNALPLAGFDAGIEIHKIPVQPPGKFPATLLLPEAMNPTRNTARTAMGLHQGLKSQVLGLRKIETFLRPET